MTSLIESLLQTGRWYAAGVVIAVGLPLQAQSDPSVAGLPITEVPTAGTPARLFAIFLSGDGGWADLDRDVGRELANAGIPVVGINSRAYLTSGRRDPDALGADIVKIVRAYQTKWRVTSFVLIGYSRGSVLAPFAATRLPADLKTQLRLVAMLGLQERAGFTFHLTDVVSKHSPKDGLPVLPELEQLRGTNMLCVYGKDEEESLCRSVDSTLVTPFARE